MHQFTRLKNGLAIATRELPHMTSVSVGIWVGTGGRYEPAELSGVSHFIEHLLFKGTRRRSAHQISQDVEGVGGYLNAFTTEENTCFYSKAHADHFDELLDVLADMFLDSRFARADIEKERSVIKEEIAMYRDQPHHRVLDILDEILWPNQPLGRALTGTEKTLDAIHRADLLAYKRANYVAPCTLIAVAGRVRHARVLKAVSRYAARFQEGRPPRFTPALNDQKEPVLRLVTHKTEQTHLAIGLRTCSRHDDRRHTLRLLNTILGENMSSRLFQVVREDHGLAYSIYSGLDSFDDVGSLSIAAGLDTANLARALKLTMRELRRMKETLPSVSELRRARDYVIGHLDLSMESSEHQMMRLGEHLLAYGKVMSPAEIKDRLHRVKPSDVRAVARDFFRPERLNVALISPLKKESGLPALLNL